MTGSALETKPPCRMELFGRQRVGDEYVPCAIALFAAWDEH